jgi:hypothetical protein
MVLRSYPHNGEIWEFELLVAKNTFVIDLFEQMNRRTRNSGNGTDEVITMN